MTWYAFFHTSLNIRNNSNKMRGLPKKCYPTKDSWLSLAWWHFVGELTAKIHPCTFICCLVRMEKLASFVAISGFFYRFALARILELCWPVGGKIVHLLLTHGLEHVFNASLSFLGASNVWMLIWMFKAQMIHLWHLFFVAFWEFACLNLLRIRGTAHKDQTSKGLFKKGCLAGVALCGPMLV